MRSIAAILSGSFVSVLSSAVRAWPRNCTFYTSNSHLFRFNFALASSRSSKTNLVLSWRVFRCNAWTRMSSTEFSSSGMLRRISTIVFWSISEADFAPNGTLIKEYLPQDVVNVKKGWVVGESFSCQKPLFRSNFVKNLEPFTLTVTYSSA